MNIKPEVTKIMKALYPTMLTKITNNEPLTEVEKINARKLGITEFGE